MVKVVVTILLVFSLIIIFSPIPKFYPGRTVWGDSLFQQLIFRLRWGEEKFDLANNTTPAPATTLNNESVIWKTYSNKVFSLLIPQAWVVDDDKTNVFYTDGEKLGAITLPCGNPESCLAGNFGHTLTFSLIPSPVNKILYDPITCKNSGKMMVDGCPVLNENKTINIGKTTAYWQILNGAPAGERLEILIPKNANETVGILYYGHLPKTPDLDRTLLPTIQQIVSTFKFL